MQSLRRRLRPWAFIAILAMLGMALAPSVSHALAASSGAAWAEVCSTSGSRWVPLQTSGGQAAPGEEAPAAPSSNPLDMPHCPLCCHLGGDTGLPPVAQGTAFLNGQGRALPPLFLQAPRTLFAWAAAQPRGPPALG